MKVIFNKAQWHGAKGFGLHRHKDVTAAETRGTETGATIGTKNGEMKRINAEMSTAENVDVMKKSTGTMLMENDVIVTENAETTMTDFIETTTRSNNSHEKKEMFLNVWRNVETRKNPDQVGQVALTHVRMTCVRF